MKLARPRVALIGAGAALVLAAGVAIPVAALTASTPVTYYACVTNSTGALKIVSKTTTCAAGQHKISWNNIGPKGPKGARGPAGVVTSYINQSTSFVALNNSEDTVVLTLQVPSGRFQVSADVGADLDDTSMPDTVGCSMLDGSNNVLDDQDVSYDLEGELTLLGDTTVGGTIEVQCFDFGDNAHATFVTIQAIPVNSVVTAAPAQHRHLLLPPGYNAHH